MLNLIKHCAAVTARRKKEVCASVRAINARTSVTLQRQERDVNAVVKNDFIEYLLEAEDEIISGNRHLSEQVI